MRVPPNGVVEALEVVADGRNRCSAGCVAFVVDEFGAEGREEALRHGIVPAVASSAHARDDAVPVQQLPVTITCIGAAAVRVVNETAGWASTSEGVLERSDSECGVVRLARSPADDAPRK